MEFQCRDWFLKSRCFCDPIANQKWNMVKMSNGSKN